MSERKNHQFIDQQINWSDQSSSFPPLFKDLYFNTDQQIELSQQDSLQANYLLKTWLAWQQQSFCIATLSFNSGLNFLLTAHLFKQFTQQHPDHPLKRLFFTSFENNPISVTDIKAALCNWPTLSRIILPLLSQYPLSLTGCHRLHFDNITLDLWFGHQDDTLGSQHHDQQGIFNCWYLNERPQDELLPIKLIVNTSQSGAILSGIGLPETAQSQLTAAGFKRTDREGAFTSYQYQHTNNRLQKSKTKDIAIIGGGISSACLCLALVKRGYHVTLYCKDEQLGLAASGNQQGALYPLLNGQHNALSQLFANSFLYASHFIKTLNLSHPFDYDLSGLLQLYYDDKAGTKLDKILQANFPHRLVHKVSPTQTNHLAGLDIGQSALFYPTAGWLNPQQMVRAVFGKAQQTGLLTINLNQQLLAFEQHATGWMCQFEQNQVHHKKLVLTTAMNTLDFKQCEALPLSAARGQVTHIESNGELQHLKRTLCHEGYLTPKSRGIHCMGATFKRHSLDTRFSTQEQIDNKQKLAKCIKGKAWVEKIDIKHRLAKVGIRCTTRDHFPYMGAIAHYQNTKALYENGQQRKADQDVPIYDNLFILTGLGSRGLTTAPLLAESLASQINHEPIPLSTSILNAMQTHRQWESYLKKGKKMKF